MQFDTPFARRARLAKPWRRLRRRQLLRRLMLLLVGLALMVGAAWGLVWLVDVFQAYNPNYYEPKDIERQLHESVQRSRGSQPAPPR